MSWSCCAPLPSASPHRCAPSSRSATRYPSSSGHLGVSLYRFFVDEGAAMMLAHYRPLLKTETLGLQIAVDLLRTRAERMLFQQVAEAESSSRPAAAQAVSALRTASPIRPRRACPPSQGRSGCRTTARSVCEASPTTRRDAECQHWDRTADALFNSSHGISPSMRSRNFSLRVFRFLLS